MTGLGNSMDKEDKNRLTGWKETIGEELCSIPEHQNMASRINDVEK
jgi:hypothetical protein